TGSWRRTRGVNSWPPASWQRLGNASATPGIGRLATVATPICKGVAPTVDGLLGGGRERERGTPGTPSRGGAVSRHFTKVFRYLLSGAHVEAERCALYATDNQESEPRGIKKSPFSLCDCLCSGILPLERADSARTKFVVQTFRGATSC